VVVIVVVVVLVVVVVVLVVVVIVVVVVVAASWIYFQEIQVLCFYTHNYEAPYIKTTQQYKITKVRCVRFLK
jgi:hypothetical protein